jgi:hypothetical protein
MGWDETGLNRDESAGGWDESAARAGPAYRRGRREPARRHRASRLKPSRRRTHSVSAARCTEGISGRTLSADAAVRYESRQAAELGDGCERTIDRAIF